MKKNKFKIGKKRILQILLCGFLVCFLNYTYCQEKDKQQKRDFKQSVLLSGDFVNATLETSLSFQSKHDLLSLTIGLEENLGLVKSKIFFSGTCLWRITPRSGIYASYYRIHRKTQYTVNEDIPYLDEIIPVGTEVDAYFNTNVASLGYIFTVVEDKKSYLGAYFNLYLMSFKTGVSSEGITLNENVSLMAPLPNFGLLSIFKVTKWLDLRGHFGLFYLRLDDFSGKINDFSLSAKFKAYKWLGVNLSYKVFDVSMQFYKRDIKTIADYNFRGPALGISLYF